MKEIQTKRINDHCFMPSILLGSYQVNNRDTLNRILVTSIQTGVYGFDTSPSYGNLSSFGEALQYAIDETKIERETLFISGKIDGWQMCRQNGDVKEYVLQSLEQLNIGYYDLLLIHWPFRKYLCSTWNSFEKMYEEGLVKGIGICNVNERFLREFLPQFRIRPQVVQNEISPLRTACDEVAFLQSMSIQIQAYSPLCRMLPDVQNSPLLKTLSEKYSKSVAQIILRWHIQRGIVPIFTSSKSERIKSNVDIFDFCLEPSEIEDINLLDQNYKIFPESYGCPGF